MSDYDSKIIRKQIRVYGSCLLYTSAFAEAQKVMPGIAVLGLAFVVGGVVSSQGSKFFTSGVVIFRCV